MGREPQIVVERQKGTTAWLSRVRASGQSLPLTNRADVRHICPGIDDTMSNTPTLTTSRESNSGSVSNKDLPRLSVSVRKGVLWNILGTLVLRLANISVTAVVAHILAPRDFGIFAVALTAYLIIYSLGELGIASCLVRADLDIDAMAPTMVTVSLVTSAIFAGTMAVFARRIAVAFGSAGGADAVRIMALAMLMAGLFAVPSAQLTRDFKQDKIFWANVISLVPSTGILLLLAKSGSGATAFAWSRVVAQFVMGCVMVASVPKHYRPGLTRGALSVLFRFGLPLAGANFVNFILLNVDYAFVGHLIGTVALGAYVLAFNAASWPAGLLGGVINNVSMPAFSRVKHDPDLLKEAITRALRAVSLILMPMCSLMMALAHPLVLTLYGAKWAASAEVLSILSLYGAISIICVLFANMMTSLGIAKFIFVIQLLWLGALVPSMALGVHRNGIVGAALAHVMVIGPLVLPSYILVLRKASGVRLTALGRATLPPLLSALAGALAAIGTASQFASPLVKLITGIAAGGLVYAIMAAPLGLALLSQEQTRKLRGLRLFRLYNATTQLVGLPVTKFGNGGHGHRGKGSTYRARRAGSTYRARHATSARRRGPVTGTFRLPRASGDPSADHTDGAEPPEAQVGPSRPRLEPGRVAQMVPNARPGRSTVGDLRKRNGEDALGH